MVVGYRPSIHLIVVGVSWDPHTSQVFFKLPDVPILARLLGWKPSLVVPSTIACGPVSVDPSQCHSFW